MQSPGASRRTPIGANMTPMIDVVFLLIIFFLVSSHLAKQETRPALDLPAAGPQPPVIDSAEQLTINVNDDGALSVGGAAIDVQRLTELVQLHVDQHGSTAAVRIRTDRSVPYGWIEPLLKTAADAGVANLAFAVREEP
jgi:biopolymer transport protein ExbD